MSAAYVRRHYRVDYKRGDRVVVDGNAGTIVSFPDQYLGVRFDNHPYESPKRTVRCHPTWRVEREEPSETRCGMAVLNDDRDPTVAPLSRIRPELLCRTCWPTPKETP